MRRPALMGRSQTCPAGSFVSVPFSTSRGLTSIYDTSPPTSCNSRPGPAPGFGPQAVDGHAVDGCGQVGPNIQHHGCRRLFG